MRLLQVFQILLLGALWPGCATALPPYQQEPGLAEAKCHEHQEDQCVTLLCIGDTCGFYRCEDVPGEVELARFPPTRPPGASAAPGSNPRRNWGSATRLPGEPVMVFPNWNGAPERIIPPSRQLTAGRWEKHHIFPQARDLAEWFKDQGVRIHDYTMPIPYDLHRRIHGGDGSGGAWNAAWREFKRQYPNAPPEQIYKHAGELIYRFQLLGGPVQSYYSRPGT